MNAARALSRAGLDTEQVRLALHPIRPQSVNLYPASSVVRSLWGAGVSAMTLGRWVLIDPDALDGDPVTLGRLTLHELFHLRQIAELGLARFLVRYLTDYFRGRLRRQSHRDAYLGVGLEWEARRLATELAAGTSPI